MQKSVSVTFSYIIVKQLCKQHTKTREKIIGTNQKLNQMYDSTKYHLCNSNYKKDI